MKVHHSAVTVILKYLKSIVINSDSWSVDKAGRYLQKAFQFLTILKMNCQGKLKLFGAYP